MSNSSNRIFKKVKIVALWFTISFLLLSIFITAFYRYINPPLTPLMLIRYLDDSSNNRRILKRWTDIDDMSRNIVLAAVSSEDQRFLEHHGFDFIEINKSILELPERGKFRGASTISQQTAKNVFLFPARSWIRKTLESYFAVLIEILWGKKRIMEVYLNVVEFGRGVYGVEAASNIYFNKSVKSLSEYESAYLVSLLPNPRVYGRNNSISLEKRRTWIIRQMKNLGGTSHLDRLFDK